MKNIPVSLYIHTPWCLKKCPYCDFNSHELRDDLPESKYIDALIADFKIQLPALQNRSLHSIFIGGGTPSLFSPDAYEKLLSSIHRLSPLPADIEITMEANPGTVEQTNFNGYREVGINRLSIGAQSFQNDKLKSLGRIHDADEATKAVTVAKTAGFENINIDVMFGLPNQTIEDGLSDLQIAMDCQPTHLSWYQLTMEPNTYFHKFPPVLPENESIWELEKQGKRLLSDRQFYQYEVSAYALENHQCQHNLNYWQFGDYIGIGAGAHGKLTHFNEQKIIRRANHKNPKTYLDSNSPFIASEKEVPEEDLSLEFMMNVLRLRMPIPVGFFLERTGLDLQSIQAPLEQATKSKLLRFDSENFQITDQGHRYLKSVFHP